MRRRNTDQWKLSLGTGETKNNIWTGSFNSIPDPIKLSAAIPHDIAEHQLTDLTVQVLRHAQSDIIPNWLGIFACAYSRNIYGLIDANKLSAIAANELKLVCGKVFKKGDLVWTCRNCGKDATCVQCDPCFRKSNHSGHEVYFHRAEGDSGCCDCGDPEAWSKHGNCTDHQGCTNDMDDPSRFIPNEVSRGFRAVVQGIVGFAGAYTTCATRAYEPMESNQFIKLMTESMATETIVARLHNDDVHTYDQVIDTLRRLRFNNQQAPTITQQVDREGFAVVLTDVVSSERLRETYDIATAESLIFSMLPNDLFQLENSVSVALRWLYTIGTSSDGLRRIISEEFLREVGSVYGHHIPILERKEYAEFSFAKVFDSSTTSTPSSELNPQFPNEITQLSSIETLPLPLSSSISYHPDHVINGFSNEDEFKDRVRRPFLYCHRNMLSVLTMASPFVTPPIKKCLHDIVMKFQHDGFFKLGFSQVFTILYPALKLLFCRHIGTNDDTIFRITVQIYTANSVVEVMSTQGIPSRILPESMIHPAIAAVVGPSRTQEAMTGYLLISNMLASTLYAVLLDLGRKPSGGNLSTALSPEDDKDFLDHHAIRTRRLAMLCRDFEYVTSNAFQCLQILQGESNPGTIELWVDVLRLLQYLDTMKRYTDTHIEYENNRWQHAANLILEVESVSTHLLSYALLDSKIDNSFHQTITMKTLSGEEVTVQAIDMKYQAIEHTLGKVIESILAWSKQISVRFHKPAEKITFRHYITGSATSIVSIPYLVSTDPISVHIPLHRFFMRMILFTTQSGLSCAGIETLFDHIVTNTSDYFAFVDYPIRCLVFAGQVNCGMWRRNGGMAANLAYNYGRIPLSHTLRDMDILAIQFAFMIAKKQADQILLLLTQRFEVFALLTTAIPTHANELRATRNIFHEATLDMLGEYLRTLIMVITFLPNVLTKSSDDGGIPSSPVLIEGLENVLRRELFHQIISGTQSMMTLMKVKGIIGSDHNISDQLVTETIQSICQLPPTSSTVTSNPDMTPEENTKLILKSESYLYYDPEFSNLNQQQSLKALEIMKDRYKLIQQRKIPKPSPTSFTGHATMQSLYDKNPHLPIVSLHTLPLPHPDFQIVRSLLIHPLMQTILQASLERATSPILGVLKFNRISIIGRVLQLLTLQLHQYMELCHKKTSSCVPLKEEEERYILSFETFFQNNAMNKQLLYLLGEIHTKEICKEDVIYQSGLEFLLYQYALLFHNVRQYLQHSINLVIQDTNNTTADGKVPTVNSVEDEKMRLRKAAQERMLAQTKLRADSAMKAFAAEMSSDEEDDDEDEEEDEEDDEADAMMIVDGKESTPVKIRKRKIPQETCIICKEKKPNPLGYLCFSQPSNYLKHLILQSPANAFFHSMYRVVAKRGCAIYPEPYDTAAAAVDAGTSRNGNKKSTGIIPYNAHVVIDAREGAWVHIISPIVGWGLLYTTLGRSVQMPTNPLNIPSLFAQNRVLALLHPVSDLLFQKHGGSRVHLSSCGHAIHMECWDMYYTASYARYINNDRSLEHMTLDMQRGECFCPLCKSIANCVLPCGLDDSFVSTTTTATASTATTNMNLFEPSSPAIPVHETIAIWSANMQTNLLSAHQEYYAHHVLSSSSSSSSSSPVGERERSLTKEYFASDNRFVESMISLFLSNTIYSYDHHAVTSKLHGWNYSGLDRLYGNTVKQIRGLYATCSMVAYTWSTFTYQQMQARLVYLKQVANTAATATSTAAAEHTPSVGPPPAWIANPQEWILLQSSLQTLLRIGHTTIHSSYTSQDTESIQKTFASVLLHPIVQTFFATSLSDKLTRLKELVMKVITITSEGKDDLLAKEFQSWSKLLQTLPFQLNVMNVKYPDDNTILDVIAYVHSLVKTAKEIVSSSSSMDNTVSQLLGEEEIDELFELVTEVWAVNHQPVLLQDLQFVFMECLTVFTSQSLISQVATLQQLIQIILMVKSTQLLLDPMSTGIHALAAHHYDQVLVGTEMVMDTSEHSTTSSTKVVNSLTHEGVVNDLLTNTKRQKRGESSSTSSSTSSSSIGSQSNTSSTISSPFVDPQDAFDTATTSTTSTTTAAPTTPSPTTTTTNAFTSEDTIYSTMAELVSIQQQLCAMLHTPIVHSSSSSSAENVVTYWLSGMIPFMEYILRVLQGLHLVTGKQCERVNGYVYHPMQVKEVYGYFQLLWNTITTIATNTGRGDTGASTGTSTAALSLSGLYRHSMMRELLTIWGKQLYDYYPPPVVPASPVPSSSVEGEEVVVQKEVRWIPSLTPKSQKSQKSHKPSSSDSTTMDSSTAATATILDQALEQLSTTGGALVPPVPPATTTVPTAFTNLLDVPITEEEDEVVDEVVDDDEVVVDEEEGEEEEEVTEHLFPGGVGGLLEEDEEEEDGNDGMDMDPNERQFEDLMRQLQLLANAGMGGGMGGAGMGGGEVVDEEEGEDPMTAAVQPGGGIGGVTATVTGTATATGGIGGIGGIGMNIGAGLANLFGQNTIAEILGLMNMATNTGRGTTGNTGRGTAGNTGRGTTGTTGNTGTRTTANTAPAVGTGTIPRPVTGTTTTTTTTTTGTSTGTTPSPAPLQPLVDAWRLIGVDPMNPCIDELSLEEYHSLQPLKDHYHTPLQGSITGTARIYGLLHGATLTTLYPDYSHFNITLTVLTPRTSTSCPVQPTHTTGAVGATGTHSSTNGILIDLPKLYTDLYHLAKFPEGPNGITIEEPVMCLVCGKVLCGGKRPKQGPESNTNPGECTIHTSTCGAGIGVFYHVQLCRVLLIRGSRACYYPSIYLDDTGEVSETLGRNRPMYLSMKRYQKVTELYATHQIGKEVARKRATSDSVIRQNWY